MHCSTSLFCVLLFLLCTSTFFLGLGLETWLLLFHFRGGSSCFACKPALYQKPVMQLGVLVQILRIKTLVVRNPSKCEISIQEQRWKSTMLRGGYKGRCPPLVPKKKNVQQTYIAYDCWANSGLTTSITLAVGNSRLQVSMTVMSQSKPISILLIRIYCTRSVRLRPVISQSLTVQSQCQNM